MARLGRGRPIQPVVDHFLPSSLVTQVAKTETFTDSFDTQISATTWPNAWGGGRAVWEAGRARVETLAAYQGVGTPWAYDLNDSYVYARIVPASPGGTTRETILSLKDSINDDGTWVIVTNNNTQLKLRRREGSTNFDNNLTYDPVNHAWVRIRKSGGQFHYDTSPDGVTWTDTGVHQTTALSMTSCQISFSAGQWGAESGTSFGYIDNVNVPATGRPKMWNGSAWLPKPAKVYMGAGPGWVEKPVKIWTGSAWKKVT